MRSWDLLIVTFGGQLLSIRLGDTCCRRIFCPTVCQTCRFSYVFLLLVFVFFCFRSSVLIVHFLFSLSFFLFSFALVHRDENVKVSGSRGYRPCTLVGVDLYGQC